MSTIQKSGVSAIKGIEVNGDMIQTFRITVCYCASVHHVVSVKEGSTVGSCIFIYRVYANKSTIIYDVYPSEKDRVI